jgi:hypothetical protein
MTCLRRAATAAGYAIAVAAVVAGSAMPAFAQADPGRVFRGLFEAPPVSQTAATFTTSMYEGYDSETDTAQGTTDNVLSGGLFSAMTPTLVLSHTRQRTAIGLSAANILRYYGQDGRILTLDRGAAFGLRHAVGRVAVQLSQTVNHRPYYEFLDVASLSTAGLGGMQELTMDHATGRYALTSYATSIEASRQSSQHQWLTAGYRFRFSHPSSADASVDAEADRLQDVVGHEASVSMMRQISRRTGVHVSYAIRTAGDALGANANPSPTHELNIGFDRFQSFTLTRNTSLSMTTGTALLDTDGGKRFTLLGSATFNHRFGRASRAAASIRRALEYVDGFQAPVLTDGVSGEFDAAISRRLIAQFRGTVSRGSIEEPTRSTPYRTAFASARLRYDFTRRIAGYAEYFDYYRNVAGQLDSPLMRGTWNRHGVRVGIIVDVPLYSDRGAQ